MQSIEKRVTGRTDIEIKDVFQLFFLNKRGFLYDSPFITMLV